MPEVKNSGMSQLSEASNDDFSWTPPPPPETTKARFVRKVKENPFVPIGTFIPWH